MNKTLIASAIAASVFSSQNVHAEFFTPPDSINMTNMVFGNTYLVGGNFYASGSGGIFSIDPFYGRHWTATQQTGFMDNTDSWNGTSQQGAFDYDAEIAAMTENQFAVGMFFDWGAPSGIAILEIFDCEYNGGGTVESPTCDANGYGVPMDNGPFTGSTMVLNGIGTVPVPGTVWLMGSGVWGLVAFARRGKLSRV